MSHYLDNMSSIDTDVTLDNEGCCATTLRKSCTPKASGDDVSQTLNNQAQYALAPWIHNNPLRRLPLTFDALNLRNAALQSLVAELGLNLR